MYISDKLLPYTVEEFLSDAESTAIIAAMDEYKAAHPEALTAYAHGQSVHSNPLLSFSELIDIYEPNGRIEVSERGLPEVVRAVMHKAFYRRIEDIRRAYPKTAWLRGITYVEYGPGQYFSPHIDGLASTTTAAFGVTLSDDFAGGEFFVETSGSNRAWVGINERGLLARPGGDMGSEWFRSLPRTRWSMKPKRGLAAFYGSGLAHGSLPVTHGTLKKVLAFMYIGRRSGH